MAPNFKPCCSRSYGHAPDCPAMLREAARRHRDRIGCLILAILGAAAATLYVSVFHYFFGG